MEDEDLGDGSIDQSAQNPGGHRVPVMEKMVYKLGKFMVFGGCFGGQDGGKKVFRHLHYEFASNQ